MENQIKVIKNTTIRKLQSEEKIAGIAAVRTCLNVKPNESVLVVADKRTWNKEAAVIFETAKSIGKKVTLIYYSGPKHNGEEPPKRIARAMQSFNVIFLITRLSLSHTKARVDACKNGTRIVSMPGITIDIMKRTLCPDYEAISVLTTKLATFLTRGEKVTIISRPGTHVSFNIGRRTGIADTGNLKNPGSFGNLPAGEAFIAPLEGTAEGVLNIDGSFANIKLDAPLAITLRKGKISSIAGKKAARILKSQLDSLPPQASWVCEFGLGTNPKAQLSPLILEAEKVLGTCHIAFGKNCTFGGTIDVPYHADGLIKEPTIMIDGKKILAEGNFLV